MFNIDSIEEFDPNTPASVELSTGFYVAWPADSEGYILEEAESPEGPWITSEGSPATVDAQNIVVMDMESRLGFYRLVKAN